MSSRYKLGSKLEIYNFQQSIVLRCNLLHIFSRWECCTRRQSKVEYETKKIQKNWNTTFTTIRQTSRVSRSQEMLGTLDIVVLEVRQCSYYHATISNIILKIENVFAFKQCVCRIRNICDLIWTCLTQHFPTLHTQHQQSRA